MKNKRTNLLKWGKYFIKIMEENNIWFSADVEMILGAQRHGGFIPWNEKLQVIMSPESYTKLQRLFPDNVIDSHYSKEYKSLKAAFVKDRNFWEEPQPFVEIRILIPTTLKKIKRFRKPMKLMSNRIKGEENTIKDVINELFDPMHEGFYVVEKRSTQSIESWIPNVTFKMIEMKFNTLRVPVIKEWKPWVIANYTKDYMKASIPEITYIYPSPLKKEKEED